MRETDEQTNRLTDVHCHRINHPLLRRGLTISIAVPGLLFEISSVSVFHLHRLMLLFHLLRA